MVEAAAEAVAAGAAAVVVMVVSDQMGAGSAIGEGGETDNGREWW